MKSLDLSVFPKTSKRDWARTALPQLKGQNPMEALLWESPTGQTLAPYYDASSTEELHYLHDFFANLSPHRWKLYEEVCMSTPDEAKIAGLKALEGGCDGLIFRLESEVDETQLLQDIDSEICDIFYVNLRKMSSEGVDVKCLSRHDAQTPCSYEVRRAENPTVQIVNLLSKACVGSTLFRTGFSDFFMEIATLRAFRYLLEKHEYFGTHIHTSVSPYAITESQWFINTTGALSSILGGTHSVSLSPADGKTSVARNTGNIIREECGITVCDDPLGGSYYLEHLTHVIIKSVQEHLKA